MAKGKDGEPRYSHPWEDGIEPQAHPPIENQQFPDEPVQTATPFPVVVEGKPRKGGKQLTISKNGEVINLPKLSRQVGRQLTVNDLGEVVATPANPQIRGGGIAPIDPRLVSNDPDHPIKRSHEKATHTDLGLKK